MLAPPLMGIPIRRPILALASSSPSPSREKRLVTENKSTPTDSPSNRSPEPSKPAGSSGDGWGIGFWRPKLVLTRASLPSIPRADAVIFVAAYAAIGALILLDLAVIFGYRP